MAVVGQIGRILVSAIAVAMIGLGSVALAGALFPEHALVEGVRGAVVDAAFALTAFDQLGVPVALPSWVEQALGSFPVQFGLAPLGFLLLIGALIPGRGAPPPPPEEDGQGGSIESVMPVEKKAAKKAHKQAVALARAGRHLEAAEICFQHALMEEAARHFQKGGELVRAAEIRHDQQRFIEAAELYLEARSFDTAGVIFARQDEWDRAADAYLQAGNHSVAAEMFEKAEEWRKAAEAYEAAEFPRHAARAWVRCKEWARAAHCLEPEIIEATAGNANLDPKRRAEGTKLVRMAADLWQRAGEPAKAFAVLERGECWAQAAEIALEAGEEEKAADLFLRAQDAPRAAKVYQALGRDDDAQRVLAEYHRDRGEDAEAAAAFEAAGEHNAAGDIYRLLDQCAKAGECYEMSGEFAQAAEMFRSVDDRERAANNYERAMLYAEAAECWALLGNAAREAELLAKAGQQFSAGEILYREGDHDGAIVILQQLDSEHADFARASAILGEIFRQRKKYSVALTKLEAAVADRPIDRDTVQAYYGLASVHEAMEDIDQALAIYEKILAFDYHFADVERRIEACRGQAEHREAKAQLEQKPPPSEGTSPLSGSQAEGRYRITGKLGRGGMGIVYKAQDAVLDRTVAFKVLPDSLKENPQALKNFLREAKSAAQLNHPNIVQIYDAGEQDDNYYIAMEYVDGNTLKEIVKARGRISAGGIVHVLAQLCEALAYAHDKKVVHRDIKTANTMWTRDRKAKIMDFGLAKVIEEVRNNTTVVSGTPYYMSPEQTLGKNIDHRTDIYSLGITLFELATGTLPFREGNLPYHHVHTPPPNPKDMVPDLPDVLVKVIERCLEKDPADRYPSTRDILTELKAATSR